MQRELIIAIDEQVYQALDQIVDQQDISGLIQNLLVAELLRVQTQHADLEASYRAMAADEVHEAEAIAWIEATIIDAFDDDAVRSDG